MHPRWVSGLPHIKSLTLMRLNSSPQFIHIGPSESDPQPVYGQRTATIIGLILEQCESYKGVKRVIDGCLSCLMPPASLSNL